MYFGRRCFTLPYCTARLVMNHQILGPQHGVPASSLARRRDHRYGLREHRHVVCRREAWAAKVIHGDLFVSRTHTALSFP